MVKSFPDQKEYLKKYLSGNKQKVKKSKNSRRLAKGVKLIDDDEAIKSIGVDDDDLVLEGEDAPQIILGEGVEPSAIKTSIKWKKTLLVEEKPEIPKFLKNFSTVELPKVKNSNEYKAETLKDMHLYANDENFNKKKEFLQEDQSPPRKRTNICKTNEYNRKSSPLRKLDREKYLPKEESSNSDLSPERRRKSEKGRSYKGKNSKKLEKDTNYSSDISPPRLVERRSSKSKDLKNEKITFRSNHSNKIRRSNSSDRQSSSMKFSSKNEHRLRKYENDFENVTEKPNNKYRSSFTKGEVSKPYHEKNTKMISGKDSGLRTAKDLAEEMKIFRKKESEMFSKLSTCADKFSEPTIRSNVRNKIETEDEKIIRKRKEEDSEKKQKVYNSWGKGLKQIESHKTKLIEEEYESSKPLARYANDKDLDDMLKQVEREGDPMLEYLRNKKEKERVNKRNPEVPIYNGSYSENRFGIRPGYRWDGVDRSNGYEKKYFEKQSVKKAQEEEAYRYSTEDM
ncbi:BUD13 homolog [Condylostylus longicornis]|uniref:BUD13 homolog n=1 Tax=Condylostylus longicornis TaxID=2530218 RepID=UPI00244E0D23|nr:BUD13 homolog [Condylostylus longicornis]